MNNLKAIPFTQYLRPHGHTKRAYIERPEDIIKKAQRLIEEGFRFECELLTTEEVVLSVYDEWESMDTHTQIVPNGPKVIDAVDQLVLEAYDDLVGEE